MNKSSDHETWFKKGIAFFDSEKLNESLPCFQKAIELKPDFIPAWIYKGMTLEQWQRYEEAIACYNKAIEINPNVSDLWYNKGATLCKVKRYPEALACFDKVLEIDPYNAIAQTSRLLTLMAPPNPIKMPHLGQESEPDNKPISAEAKAEIQLRTKQEIPLSTNKEIELT